MDLIQWIIVGLIFLLSLVTFSLNQCLKSLQVLVLINDEKLEELRRQILSEESDHA